MLWLVVPVLATSCIKEDFDNCDNVTIYFQYKADGDTDVLYQYMSKVDLYVFDESGHILGVGHYNQDELSNFAAKPSFKLRPGRYKVVAVGNAYDNTKVVNLDATSFNDIFIQSPQWQNGAPVTNHDDNYMGQKTFIVPPVVDGVMFRDTVTLYSSHIDVAVEINGLPAPASRDAGDIPYILSIEGSNAATDFNNEIDELQKGTIYPELVYDYEHGCYHTVDLALFRMDTNGQLDPRRCQHVLKLTDREGNVWVEGKLYDYLVKNEGSIDVTKQEALLPISINFKQTEVTIEPPAWYIEDVLPGWE